MIAVGIEISQIDRVGVLPNGEIGGREVLSIAQIQQDGDRTVVPVEHDQVIRCRCQAIKACHADLQWVLPGRVRLAHAEATIAVVVQYDDAPLTRQGDGQWHECILVLVDLPWVDAAGRVIEIDNNAAAEVQYAQPGAMLPEFNGIGAGAGHGQLIRCGIVQEVASG